MRVRADTAAAASLSAIEQFLVVVKTCPSPLSLSLNPSAHQCPLSSPPSLLFEMPERHPRRRSP